MKTCIIINPNAGNDEQSKRLQEVLESHHVECWRTQEKGDGKRLVERALAEGYECIAAAGGDGTIHEIANALLAAEKEAVLGIVPLGTGNDLARTLCIPDDPAEAVKLFQSGEVHRLDAIRVEFEETQCYAINASAGGFSGQVDKAMSSAMKDTWGPFAYILGAVGALPELEEYEARITFDDLEEVSYEVYNIVVANGRTIGGGKQVAPYANPEDGLLEVMVIVTGSLMEMTGVASQLLSRTHLNNPHVGYRRAKRVHIDSRPGMAFNVDGELVTEKPVTFTVEAGALPVIVGHDYHAVPDIAYAPRSGS